MVLFLVRESGKSVDLGFVVIGLPCFCSIKDSIGQLVGNTEISSELGYDIDIQGLNCCNTEMGLTMVALREECAAKRRFLRIDG